MSSPSQPSLPYGFLTAPALLREDRERNRQGAYRLQGPLGNVWNIISIVICIALTWVIAMACSFVLWGKNKGSLKAKDKVTA